MVVPRFASTVVMVRPDDQGGFEVLLTRRPSQMRFLGGFYVFPGGTVHEADYSPSILRRCRGLSGDQARSILDNSHEASEALGHWVAVVRELFEEVGVLLCVDEDGREVDMSDQFTSRRLEVKRRALVNKQLDFMSILETENFFCDLARVVYFDHWVTPEIYSMRFDTRFFIAAQPAKQTILARSEEVTHSLWINAAEAMARLDRVDFPIVSPTTTILQRLARVSSWNQLRAGFRLP